MTSVVRLFFKIGFILVLVAGFAFYGFNKAQDFLTGPKIIISQPENGQVFSKSYIIVSGQVKNISSLFLNGRKIFTDENGFFNENLLLALGYNIIEVQAKDKFGRSVKEKREIVIK